MTEKTTKKVEQVNNFLLSLKKLKENIDLKSKAGLVCIRRAMAESDEIILVVDDRFGDVNQTFKPLPLLTLIFNKGVDIEAQLTHGDTYGPYSWNHEIGTLDGSKYDAIQFEKWFKKINSLCKARDTKKNKKGRKMSNMLQIYQNAHLLIPKFYDESYLNLLRILDALGKNDEKSTAIIFPLRVVKILPKRFINRIHKDIESIEYNKKYLLPLIKKEFNSFLSEYGTLNNTYKRKYPLANIVKTDKEQIALIALYAAYKYRNKYIHEGFILPHKIQDFFVSDNNAINYFGSSHGEMHLVHYNPEGNSESIDIHKYLSQKQAKEYQKIYRLLPTWYFLNLIVREVLFYRLKKI